MQCLPQNRENHRLTKKRTIAFVLLICYISISLLSGAYILTHSGHTHDHDGVGGACAACAQIQSAESTLKQFSAVFVSSVILLEGYYIAAIIKEICFDIVVLTPVTAKIRMNN